MAVKNTKFKDAGGIIENVLASGRKILLPDEAMDVIKSSGIPTPAYALAKTTNEAVTAAKSMGFPVALKIVSPDVLHKSDVGGVVVGVENDKEVERNYNEIMNNLIGKVPDDDIVGMLVEKQMPTTTEVIVGGIRDKQFGPTVMFGLGGIFVELFKDVAFRIAPVTEVEASEMIREIKAYPALSGYRGSKTVNIKQIVKAIIIISELISNISIIKEVELNPLLVYEKNIMTIDARVILR